MSSFSVIKERKHLRNDRKLHSNFRNVQLQVGESNAVWNPGKSVLKRLYVPTTQAIPLSCNQQKILQNFPESNSLGNTVTALFPTPLFL